MFNPIQYLTQFNVAKHNLKRKSHKKSYSNNDYTANTIKIGKVKIYYKMNESMYVYTKRQPSFVAMFRRSAVRLNPSYLLSISESAKNRAPTLSSSFFIRLCVINNFMLPLRLESYKKLRI